jgi:hypothetical protein
MRKGRDEVFVVKYRDQETNAECVWSSSLDLAQALADAEECEQDREVPEYRRGTMIVGYPSGREVDYRTLMTALRSAWDEVKIPHSVDYLFWEDDDLVDMGPPHGWVKRKELNEALAAKRPS